jgi:uncharacterized protein (TIGR02271 family)
VKTGSVRVDKEARKQVRKLRAPLIHDDVEVRRVPVHKVVEEAPRVRTVGSTIIVPVVEEELVVTKRLVVKEEIHLIQRRTKRQVTKAVEVVREHARVRRLDPEGRVIDPEADHPTPGRGKPWRSVLD